jgi:hypothetical protein
MGTPAYMSPEQANGQSLDGRSDLFAVGIMLWEMLVGRRLFIGTDTRAILAAVLFGQVPKPRTLRPDIPKDLERVVMKLLERDLPARYGTAEEAIADLLGCTDAPRNGRELLHAILLERFPNEAPIRQSIMRARQSLPPGSHGAMTPDPNVVHAAPYQLTMQGHQGPQHANALSLGAMMNAPTGTIDHRGATIVPPRKSSARLGIALLLVAVLAVGVFAIVAASGGGGEPKVAAAAIGAGAVVVAVPADAPPVPPPVVLVDASVPDAPAPPDAPPKDLADKPDTRPKKYGSLKVTAFPRLVVTVGKIKLGLTPTAATKIPVGTHQMKLTYGDGKHWKTESITITEGQLVTRDYTPPAPD